MVHHVRRQVRRWLRRGTRQDERGAAAIEFALVTPLLLVLVFGIIQYGWYFYAMQAGTSAAGDVARRASVGDCQSGGDAAALATERVGPAASGAVTADVSGSFTPDAIGETVTVTVTFDTADFNLWPISEFYDPTVSRTVSARLEDTEPSSGGC